VGVVVGVLCAVAAAVLVLVAVNDHRDKQERMHDAHRALWSCRRDGTACDAPSPASIERAWNRRERGYAAGIALAGLGVVGGIAFTLGARSRARQRTG
jgi:hypothetical protein